MGHTVSFFTFFLVSSNIVPTFFTSKLRPPSIRLKNKTKVKLPNIPINAPQNEIKKLHR